MSREMLNNNTWSELKNCLRGGRFRTDFGRITDDTSMARCLADTILAHNFKMNNEALIDLIIRFILWWYFGYNNSTENKVSFGLGGNIS
jgi:ADP-ribosyl-[dinitrogen reductase] hydrolase